MVAKFYDHFFIHFDVNVIFTEAVKIYKIYDR